MKAEMTCLPLLPLSVLVDFGRRSVPLIEAPAAPDMLPLLAEVTEVFNMDEGFGEGLVRVASCAEFASALVVCTDFACELLSRERILKSPMRLLEVPVDRIIMFEVGVRIRKGSREEFATGAQKPAEHPVAMEVPENDESDRG